MGTRYRGAKAPGVGMETRFVAEAGSNGNGSLLRYIRMIDAAADAGFTAFKTQQFTVRSLFRPEAREANPDLDLRVGIEVPEDWHETLCERAHDRGMEYGITPFYESCVQPLSPFVDFWKVSSYDILRPRLIGLAAKTGKHIIISTGMATMDEVMAARQAALRPGLENRLTLLHCVSSYPTPADQTNLKAIDTMQKFCGQPVGWSDHTRSFTVIERAVWRWRASTIELHVDLDDGNGAESGGHCWSMLDAERIIRALRDVAMPERIERDHESDGHGRKEPMPCEETERLWRADPVDGLRPLKQQPQAHA